MQMHRLFPVIIVTCFTACSTIAQTKPALPANFFDGFSYQLPNTVKADKISEDEIRKIAAEINKVYVDAFSSYRFTDSIQFKRMLITSVPSLIFTDQHKRATDNIALYRRLEGAPAYALPPALMFNIYANARLASPAKQISPQIFAAKLKAEAMLLHPDFKNDIVNRLKGFYNDQLQATSSDDLKETLAQALASDGGKMNFTSADGLLYVFLQDMIARQLQPVIQRTLVAINPSESIETKIAIPMRDGIKLNAYRYHDKSVTNAQPALLSLSPYPSGYEASRGNVIATNGYDYIYVDTRGRRESEGEFFPYEHDARDYYDIIDWVSKQPWCNGKVGTTGGSYLGFVQWQAIRQGYKHPALKAINPMVAVGFGVDFPRFGNAFYPYILQWAIYVSGKQLNDALFNDYKFWDKVNYTMYKNRIPFSKLDSVAGMPNKYFQKWVSHPDFDSYWKKILPSEEDYRKLDIPVFTITGYFDADQNGAFHYYNNHLQFGSENAKAEHYLLIGPWDHGGSQWQPGSIHNGRSIDKEAQVPVYKYMLQWFDWKLKNAARPAFLKDRVVYFESDNHRWNATASLTDLATDSLVFYPSPVKNDGEKRRLTYSLTENPPASGTINYRHDISMAIDSLFLYGSVERFNDTIDIASPYNLIFETAPLESDIMITDRIRAEIAMKLNVPDADFSVLINEITPDGRSMSVSSGSVRTRYRNGEQPELAIPGKEINLRFDNGYLFIKKIPKGSRIRMIFQSVNDPWTEKNYGFGGVVAQESTTAPRVIEAEIITGSKTRLVVPIRKQK